MGCRHADTAKPAAISRHRQRRRRLYPADRDPFIVAVAVALEGQPIGDGTIGRVIREVQCRFDHPEPEHVAARWEREKPRFERSSKRAF